jgi:hypothetical protein
MEVALLTILPLPTCRIHLIPVPCVAQDRKQVLMKLSTFGIWSKMIFCFDFFCYSSIFAHFSLVSLILIYMNQFCISMKIKLV